MKAQTRIVTAGFCLWLSIIGWLADATPQQEAQYRPVRISKGEQVDFRLRYLRPIVGSDPRADIAYPEGKARVTRDNEFTSIDIEIRNLPRNPGRYFLYLIQDDNTAKQIAEFGTQLALLQRESSELESFRLAVSTDPGLTIIESGRDDVVMLSIAP
jgi:hypothetical protein